MMAATSTPSGTKPHLHFNYGNNLEMRAAVLGDSVCNDQSMDGSHAFPDEGVERVKADMNLNVLAYNFRRSMSLLGMQAMRSADQ